MDVRDYEDPLGDENFLLQASLFIRSYDWHMEAMELLAEMQLDVNGLGAATPPLATFQVRTPLQPLSHTLRPINREESPALLPGQLSPAVSQDEMVIRQRGRRRLPVSWSPDIELKSNTFNSTDRTPPKIAPHHLSPQKVDVNLRSTPRKRLIFRKEPIPLSPEKIDFSDLSTPEKFKITSSDNGTPPTKRPRIEKL